MIYPYTLLHRQCRSKSVPAETKVIMDLIAQFTGVTIPTPLSTMSAEDAKVEAEERNLSYVTLLCDDSYFNGVCVLLKTLKDHRKRNIPITVLADSKGVSKATIKRLESMSCEVIAVDTLLSPSAPEQAGQAAKEEDAAGCWAASEMTKLRIWSLVQFERIVYIDADCFLLENCDDLFESTKGCDFAAAPDVFPPDRFNAGVMVVRPSLEVFEDLCEKLLTLHSYDGGDTGFLNAYFPSWYSGPAESRLSFGYNMQRILYWFTYEKRPGYWNSIFPKKIVHFSSSPKPWEQTIVNVKGDLEMMWWTTLMK